jgi:teichuronic acid biosynthesis glycosyltransferase TuaC
LGGDISRADIAQEIPRSSVSASLPLLLEATPGARKRLHVLTLTPFYPFVGDDAQGCFVAEPLSALEELGISNSVLAVRPFYRGRARPCKSAPAAYAKGYFSLPGGLGLPFSGASLFGSILHEVRRLHKRNPVHLIHAHSALPCGHAAALLTRHLGIPFVVSVHGLDAFFTNQVGGYAGKWCKRISQQVYCSARTVVCISEQVRAEVTRNIDGPLSTTVIYNGADPDRFYPELSSSPPNLVLSVGNLIPIKGHELLLRAFAAIGPGHPTLRCEIIGDGPERSRLIAVSTQLGIAKKVNFLGRQSRTQVADAMRRCIVLALPSHYEGLGCVYLEAMSAGKPVIACRGQGIQEVIQHGVNGFLIDPGDAHALTETLSVLLANPQLRKDIGRNARLTILRSFTLAHQAERLAHVYRGCLA